ncbi:tyrosine-type recombinase/integrase [Ottowia pentelensis]|uniref:Tyrosine-type recombinase/integrase n=2 Tax=Ottowia pentelensis TaxID=511108 RepID=A0ABV6PQ63_9BURK|nr:tyrosine-type recombinase/integrase [Pseudomonadota bacterium]
MMPSPRLRAMAAARVVTWLAARSVSGGASKSRRARSIPIVSSLRPWLAYLPLDVSAEGIKSGFRRAREKAGMPEVQFRDLRRSCGTLMRQHGVDLHTISRILGHSSVQVTERVYAHLSTQQMREGLEVLDGLHSGLHSERKTLRSL